ncbi:MAG TPA: hypothetical protein VJM46_02905 [Candidatus Saccharimonadales bacterium]|nr:hypothetical protein [Candidatus Saccharimonadales bacterium]
MPAALQYKSPRHRAVAEAAQAAFDAGKRDVDLIAAIIDKVDEVRSAASLPQADTQTLTTFLMMTVMGADRDALPKAINGFNII